MPTTSRTLLERARDPGDAEAWERFYGLYAPLLERYARRIGLAPWDAEEVRDQCLLELTDRMRSYDHDPTRGGFKSWLRWLVRARVRDHQRRAATRRAEPIEELVADEPAPDAAWEAEWRGEHLRYALGEVREELGDAAYRAFAGFALEGRPAAVVAAETGLTEQQVYKLKPRVLAEVRRVLERLGLSDEDAVV